jgi:ADP-ribose pyrophosphatase
MRDDILPIRLTRRDYRLLAKESLYHGFFSMEKYHLQCRLFEGGWSETFDREVLLRYRVAAVLPYDPRLDKVVLIEQFRAGALQDEHTPWLLELIAGILTDTTESLEQLACRETYEEAGLHIEELLPICDYWVSPGGSSERVALFCARVDASQAGGIYGVKEENEDILVHVLNAQDAFDAVRSGRINNAVSIIALQWLELNQRKLRAKWL